MKTTWEVWTYDVWGNKEDGYDVNDRYCQDRELVINVKPQAHNVGTDRMFVSAHISDYQLKKIFGTYASLDVDGDDLNYYVNRESDGYPIGELHCTSHKSLSPIRE